MTLDEIRSNIEKDSVGMLYSDDYQKTLIAIEDFRDMYHYLPSDIDEWYDDAKNQSFLYDEALAGDWEG